VAINELLFNLVFVLPYYMISQVKLSRDIRFLVTVKSGEYFSLVNGKTDLRLDVYLCKFSQSLPVCVFFLSCVQAASFVRWEVKVSQYNEVI